jgi:ABC-2 type transport system permease protein
MLLGDAVRYTIASTMVIVLGLALGFRPDGGAVGVLAAVVLVVLFSFSLAWIWTALGLVLRTPGSVMGVSSFILFPLTFVSNIFVDPKTMPSVLRASVDANPISWLVTAARGLMHGTASAGEVGSVLLACAVLVAVFGPVTMYLYRTKR